MDPEGSGRGGRSVDVEKALVLAGELGDPAGKEGAGVGSGGHCEGLSRGAGRREVVLILRERERRGAGEWRRGAWSALRENVGGFAGPASPERSRPTR